MTEHAIPAAGDLDVLSAESSDDTDIFRCAEMWLASGDTGGIDMHRGGLPKDAKPGQRYRM